MNPKSIQFVPAGIALAAGLSIMLSFAALLDDVTKEKVSMQELPGPVRTLCSVPWATRRRRKLRNQLRGIVVLYEAEYVKDGQNYALYVYPNEEVAARQLDEPEQDGS